MPNYPTYLDFEIDVRSDDANNRYIITVVNSPAGEVREVSNLPFGDMQLKNRLLELQNALLSSGGLNRRGLTSQERTVQVFGKELFDFLLPGEVRSLYRSSRGKAATGGLGLRLKLRIQDPALAALPWELLFDSVHNEYVCLSTQTPIVRYMEMAQPPRTMRVQPPLRILGLIASPKGVKPLNIALEKQRVEDALKELVARGLVELYWLPGQTWRDLQRAMRLGPWHIFHYIGHGGFDHLHNEGQLILADAAGQPAPINAEQLGHLLGDHTSLGLAFLNACEGATSSQTDLFSSTAATLMGRGIPAVLAMQHEITDQAAIEFTTTLYESLADGYPVDAAVAEARKAISLAVTHSVEWGTPMLHMRAPDGVVFIPTQDAWSLAERMQNWRDDIEIIKIRDIREGMPLQSLYHVLLAEENHLSLKEDWWEQLKDHVHKSWFKNSLAEEADWLRLSIGVDSGNRKRVIHFEKGLDGVHSIIAGGTLSGKTELLRTFIVGLALTYSPEILNFVLVDFKSGGAFTPFKHLPHCVSIVTNLNASAVDRMFTAINAEMKRRQALNQKTNTKDIVDYRRKGFHKIYPYPHLFVIIDEYAEMIDNNPEYRAELESITRVGRAQGVNLILASQKPKGVTDQMRANIKLRICLRVEDQETSREMLRRTDAAQLPNDIPGRGYIQVGNENLELIQISWTGNTVERPVNPGIEWLDHLHKQSDSLQEAKLVTEKAPFFEHAVNVASELWGERLVPRPWPDFLPRFLSLQSEIVDSVTGSAHVLAPVVSNWLNGESTTCWPGVDWLGSAFSANIGLIDDPVQARQFPLSVDLKRNHFMVMGDGGYGKTSLMRSILTGLAATHSPQELHAYIVDLSGHNYSSMEVFPHVGSVIYGDEETFDERFNQLLAYLKRTQRTRQRFMRRANVASFYDYNFQNPNNPQPLILVIIDDIAELQQDYELLIDSMLLPLMRTSMAVGIAFVVSANQPSDLPSKLYNLFGQRLTFHQTNRDRYVDIVGRGAMDLDDIPGRGYIRWENRPLQFQAAVPVGLLLPSGEETFSGAHELRLMASNMQKWVKDSCFSVESLPTPIKVLAKYISLDDILIEAATPGRSRVQAVIGRNDDLEPALIDIEHMGNHFSILGQFLSGKTTTLYTWIFSLAQRYDPSQVAFVLVDVRRKFADYGGTHTLAELPHVLESITDSDDFPLLAERLLAEGQVLQSRKTGRHIFVMIDNFDDFSYELERKQDVARDFALIARRYGQDGIHFVVAGSMNIDNRPSILRHILAGNYGIVLRSLALLQANYLRVYRTPRNAPNELPVGRGYFVRSGQVNLIQVASPYERTHPYDTDDMEDDMDDDVRWMWLDRLVEKVCQQYATIRTGWSVQNSEEQPEAATAEMSAQQIRLFALVKRMMQIELSQATNDDDNQLVLTKKVVSEGINTLLSKATLVDFVRQKLIAKQVSIGLPESMVADMYKAYKDQDVIIEAESLFPPTSNR